MTRWAIAALGASWALAACPPPAPGPVAPADGLGDGGCEVAGRITAERLIRDPNTGMAVVVPCDAGAR